MPAINIPILNPTCSGVNDKAIPSVFAHSVRAIVSTTIPNVCGATEAPKSPPAAIKAYAALLHSSTRILNFEPARLLSTPEKKIKMRFILLQELSEVGLGGREGSVTGTGLSCMESDLLT